MIIVMQLGATQAQIDGVVRILKEHHIEPLVLPGEDRVAIGIPQTLSTEMREQVENALARADGISKVTQTSRPYKLASLEFQRERTFIDVKGVRIGPGSLTIMAGPCSVESYDQMARSAELVKKAGAKVLRGGAFKPRTSPYSFQGLAEEGLKIMKKVADEHALVSVSEVMSPDAVDLVSEYIDILQIGARSMQNFPLLVAAGKSGKPIFLKRGPSATIDEFLLAAEYLLANNNKNVILCERGIVPLDRAYTRNTLDLAAVPVLKAQSHLPVFADPSHGTGVSRYVAPMARAAVVVGADGIMLEVHPNPEDALSDGSQALNPKQFTDLMADLKRLAEFSGLTL